MDRLADAKVNRQGVRVEWRRLSQVEGGEAHRLGPHLDFPTALSPRITTLYESRLAPRDELTFICGPLSVSASWDEPHCPI